MPDRTLTLPSGRIAVIKRGMGRQLREAQRLASDPNDIPYYLITLLVQVDGKELDIDAVLDDLEVADVIALTQEVTGKSQASPASSTSSSSATSPTGASETSTT